TNIMLEYQFPSKWLLVNITTQRTGNVSTIAGFHVEPLRDSLENLNRFTLVGKSTDQYLLLIVAVGSLLLSLYSFVLCIRTKNEKRKWLWMLFILIGVGKLAVNWTTGQWNLTLWSFQIPCGMATAPLYGPWTIAASAPLGAILYFIRHGKIKNTGESIPQSVNLSD
ncbi:MAG TPA: hypothetical protein VNO32_29585, partial [Candidatus Acidoferrum sp.]|nr:hypothetical protein [Candidatus Acidoferrum sp.]